MLPQIKIYYRFRSSPLLLFELPLQVWIIVGLGLDKRLQLLKLKEERAMLEGQNYFFNSSSFGSWPKLKFKLTMGILPVTSWDSFSSSC